MIGNIKFLGLFLIIFFSCSRRDNNVDIGRELIYQNINILIDSIEQFDSDLMPVSHVSTKDFKNYKPVKNKKWK